VVTGSNPVASTKPRQTSGFFCLKKFGFSEAVHSIPITSGVVNVRKLGSLHKTSTDVGVFLFKEI